MSKLDTVTFKGQSGCEYSCRVYPWEHEFKSLAAVYVVTERVVEPNTAPAYSPVYVGVSDDLARVFESHEKSECFQMYYANTIAVLPVPNASERARIEQDLLEALDPPCNGDDPC